MMDLCQSGTVVRPSSSPAGPGHLATRPQLDDPRHRDAARSFAAGDDRDWANRFVWADRTSGRPPTNQAGSRPPARKLGRDVGAFVRRHGWRAYALPILVVITVVALTSTVGQGHDHPIAPAPGTGSSTHGSAGASSAPSGTSRVKVDTGSGAEVLPGDALPPGPAYTTQGKGTFTILKGIANPVGHGRLVTYAIEVEDGVTGVDTGAFQRLVLDTLSDPRSWTGSGNLALQRVDSPDADVRIALTSSMTVRQICGYDQKIETPASRIGTAQQVPQCRPVGTRRRSSGQDPPPALHDQPRVQARPRAHAQLRTCRRLAPVMMQQTITLRENRGAGPKIASPTPGRTRLACQEGRGHHLGQAWPGARPVGGSLTEPQRSNG
jgi:hypothetical protein